MKAMEKQLKKRYFDYLTAHYGRMSMAALRENVKQSISRLVTAKVYPEEVIKKAINDMADDGYSLSMILAHLDMVDIENRT